jgi:hypothetical protein
MPRTPVTTTLLEAKATAPLAAAPVLGLLLDDPLPVLLFAEDPVPVPVPVPTPLELLLAPLPPVPPVLLEPVSELAEDAPPPPVVAGLVEPPPLDAVLPPPVVPV